MKRKIALLLTLAFIPLMQTSAFADNDIAIVVNGDEVQLDQVPVIENGRTLVPFRAVLEKMGATVDWDNATQTVTCALDDNEVSLVIGSDKMQTTQGEITLDVPAKIMGSRTMVPIRAISEGLGATVDWDGENRVVTVTSSQAEEISEDITEDATEEIIVPVTPVQTVTYTMTTISDTLTNNDVSLPITAKYPVLSGDSDEINAINSSIATSAKAIVSACKQEYADFLEGATSTKDWSIDITYDVKTLDDGIVSIYVTNYSYFGGAHPNTLVSGLTYNLQTGEKMTAEDFIENALAEGEEGIRAMAQADPEQYPLYDEATFALTDKDFYIDNTELVFLVQAYEIAPYSSGVIEYRIDLEGI